MASPKCRFYDKNVAEAITSFGRFIIQKAKNFAIKNGHKVIYGDTDSIFVHINKKNSSFEEKLKIGKEFERKINKFFELWINKEFKQKNYLKIELEKIFTHFFIASKKRYVGFDILSNKNVFVGIEAIRGDWTPLAKKFQIELIELMFKNKSKEEIIEFILNYIENLKKGKFDNLLIYKKKITKPLKFYIKTTPPHVKAARELSNFKGRIVEYIITKDGPKHISKINKESKIDYDHYIEKQLFGVSDDLLESFGIDFKKIIFDKKQKSLDKFF